jgi:hypothetical protein
MKIVKHSAGQPQIVTVAPMKPIKISAENKAAIEDALEEVNGQAWRHCFDRHSEIEDVVKAAERWLTDKLPKKMWKGAECKMQSGTILAKAYRNSARTTTVRIERRASGWFLIDIQPSVLWPDSRPLQEFYLTEEQSNDLLRRVRSQYGITKAMEPAAKAA